MTTNQPPQFVIEKKMKEITHSGNYDMVHLFSSEGLPLAEYFRNDVIDKERLTELSLLLKDIQKMADVMGKISYIKEMIVEGFNHRKLIFRFFRAFNQEVVLAIVVPPKKPYRNLTNTLVKIIENIEFK